MTVTAAPIVVVSAWLLAPPLAGAAGRVTNPHSTGASAGPVQPVVTEPAPAASHKLPFGSATVTPTTIVAGAPHQNIRVTVRVASSNASVDRLLVRLGRPGQPATAGMRAQPPFVAATRSLDLRGVGAGKERSLELTELNPPAGEYRLDFLVDDDGGGLRSVDQARVVVYGQNRLPPTRASSAFAGVSTPPGARGFASGSANFDINNEAGNQAETFSAVRQDDPKRAIAAVNPSAGNPKAWISNNYMRNVAPLPVVATLPSTTLMPTSEGGGTVSLTMCCDPMFAADTLGNLWYGVLTSGATSHIVVNRVAGPSGTTFQTNNTALHRVTTALQDKPMMTIDNTATSPKFGMLYVVWNENGGPGQNTVFSQCNTRPGGISTPAFCDNPDNWTGPTKVTDAAGSYIYASVAVAPNGDVYVAWQNYAAPPGGNRISIDRCLAGSNCASALNWGTDQLVATLDASGGTGLPFFCPIISAPGGRVGPQPYVDVGPTGLVSVAYSNLRANGASKCSPAPTDRTFDSFIDTGTSPNTFPAPDAGKRLSDDAPTAANDHYFPSLTVDQTTGEIQSSLYSTKADALGQKTHQYAVTSYDDGGSFAPMAQITSATSDFSGSAPGAFDYGDYEGADSARGLFLPVWTDNRTANGANAADLYTHAAPSGDIGPTAVFGFSPPFALPGQTVSFDGSRSADPDGTIAAYSWNFGDGSPAAPGATTTHAYAAPGTYNVTLTVTDDAAKTGSLTRPLVVVAPPLPPVPPFPSPLAALSRLRISPTSFPAAPSGPSATKKKKKKKKYGATVSYTLNLAASVRFTVTQNRPGRKVGKGKKARCVPQTKKNRKAKKCTRTVTLRGSFTRSGKAGSNSFRFTGRLNGRKIPLGRYSLVGTPTANGTRGRPASVGFRIVR